MNSDTKILQAYNAMMRGDLRAKWILARKLQGLKQSDIARELGLTQSTVSMFENGVNMNWKLFQFYYSKFGGE